MMLLRRARPSADAGCEAETAGAAAADAKLSRATATQPSLSHR